jgi:hypothetical protein
MSHNSDTCKRIDLIFHLEVTPLKLFSEIYTLILLKKVQTSQFTVT